MELVQALGNLDDMSAFGATLALACLPLLYVGGLAVLGFLPLYLKVRRKVVELEAILPEGLNTEAPER